MTKTEKALDRIPARVRRLVSSLLRGEAPPGPPPTLDEWEELATAIEPHCMLPLICWYVVRLPPQLQPPDCFMDPLREAFAHSHVQALQAQRQLAALGSAFQGRGVDQIVLKGPALAWSVYPHPGTRPCADMDLLVRESEMDEAHAALKQLGYRCLERRFTPLLKDVYHHDIYTPGPGLRNSSMVELHWKLTPFSPSHARTETATLFERAVRITSSTCTFLGLHPVDSMLHAATHQAVKHAGESRLLWICDIAFLARRLRVPQDWAALQQRITNRVELQAVKESLAAASEWLGYEPPDGFRDLEAWPRRDGRTVSQFSGDQRNAWRDQLLAAARAPDRRTLSGQARFWLHVLFPAPASLKLNYPVPHDWLLPAVYLQRIAKWLGRLLWERP